MTDEAATGLDQTASVAPAAETNPTPAPEAPAPEAPVDPTPAPVVEPTPAAPVEPEAPKSLFEQFVEYLEKELNEGEEALGQLFQLHFRKNADGSKNIAIQATGKASALTEFSVPKTEA